ncbi:hypothetical protein QYM36_011741 [Artemia franciscana]|uniref:Uncharacterized protein n=1 Tax=Artemia franciscana TaxID=6661 RepID=A0AA88I0A7_ARTSF|nr:hypothetical protein QYM36_011741 [Artemia franciscana]
MELYRRNRKFIHARPTTNECTYLQNNMMPLTNMEVPMEPEPLYESPLITSPSSNISWRFSLPEESFQTPRANQQPNPKEPQSTPPGFKATATAHPVQPNLKMTRSGRVIKEPARLNL